MYTSYYIHSDRQLTPDDFRESIHAIETAEACWLPNRNSDTCLWEDVPDLMRLSLCRCRRRDALGHVVEFILEVCMIDPSDSDQLQQRIQTEVTRYDVLETITALIACDIYYGIGFTLAYMILGQGPTSVHTVMASALETGDARACRFLVGLYSTTVVLPHQAKCSAYIATAVYEYGTRWDRPSDPRISNAYVRILYVLWNMARTINLYTLLLNATKPGVDQELVELVFRVLEVRVILIPHDPPGNYRNNIIGKEPVDHPDAYYQSDTGSYAPNPCGYFRDMVEYACWKKLPGLLKKLLDTPPARFEDGLRPSLHQNHEFLYAVGSGNLESVRVLLAADRDWKLGTDPAKGWELYFVEDMIEDMKEENDGCYDHVDLDTIIMLLEADKRN